MSLSLYRKYRPQRFEEVVGQDHIKKSLQGGIRSGRISHAYLFAGPRGTGKTTTARLFAKALNCLEIQENGEPCLRCEICEGHHGPNWPDLIEIDAASHRGINEIKELREMVRYLPQRSRRKVFIIDEVHMLTNEAFNALLKTLEEPPSHAIFILATTEPHKVPSTIISRCQRFDFKKVSSDILVERLKYLAGKENIEIDENVLRRIAVKAEGGVRDAETILGQILALGESKIGQDEAELILPRSNLEELSGFYFALLACDNEGCFRLIQKWQNEGESPEFYLTELLELLRWFILLKTEFGRETVFNKFGSEQTSLWEEKLTGASLKDLRNLLSAMLNAKKDMEICDNLPWLPIEMLVVDAEKGRVYKDESAKAMEEIALEPLSLVAKLKRELTENSFSMAFLLKNCLIEEVQGKLVFTFKYPFHAEKIKDIKNTRLIGEIWEKISGKKADIEIRVDSSLILTQDGGVLEGVEDKKILKSALDIFGGEIMSSD